MMRTVIGSPTIFCQRCSGVSPVDCDRRDGADLRRRQKAAQPANHHDQAALVEADDLAVVNAVVFQHLLHVFPGDLFLGAAEGKDHVTVLIFGVDHIDGNFCANNERLRAPPLKAGRARGPRSHLQTWPRY